MTHNPLFFSALEWRIALAYLRAGRREGGISVIASYALIGVMLGVATLIVVQAVMVGFREEFTDKILGANAHVSLYYAAQENEYGGIDRLIGDFEAVTAQVSKIDGVVRAAPLVRGQVMASASGRTAGVEVIGIKPSDLTSIPLVSNPVTQSGDITHFGLHAHSLPAIAIGQGVARDLNLKPGDTVTLISPNGTRTPFGTQPRLSDYKVAYIFGVGRSDIDRTRVYMPFSEAQYYFDREAGADEIDITLERPDMAATMRHVIQSTIAGRAMTWTWEDANGAFLSALDTERRVMFIILSLVILIAALNIISGLVMLVKNKTRDIGVLRTMGLSSGSIMRIFFLTGSLIGMSGTTFGVVIGCLFAAHIQEIQALVEMVSGGSVWDPELRFLTEIPARLRPGDILAITGLSLSLSFFITLWPARSAARLNPVEALAND